MKQMANPEEARNTTLIVVLGMHRSGTSAITRAMETMDADLGSRLMPGVEGVNEKGFFEDIDINAINVEVVGATGMDWHTMAPIELNAIDRPYLDQLQTKAIAVLREKCEGKTFVLKDPRIARLLPFWQPVFTCLGARIVYVVAIRNPISVASSLAKRDKFTEEKSYVLWLAHIVPALLMTSDSARVIVDYDRLMDSPRPELVRISSELGLPLNMRRVAEFEQEFLDDNLRHTRFTARDLDMVHAASRAVKELFADLETASSTSGAQGTLALKVSLECAQKYLEDIAPWLKREWQIEQQTHHLKVAIADCNRRIAELNQTLHDSEVREENSRVRLEQLSSDNRSLEEIVRSMEDAAAAQRAELSRSTETIDRILVSTSWRVTAPFRTVREYMLRVKR